MRRWRSLPIYVYLYGVGFGAKKCGLIVVSRMLTRQASAVIGSKEVVVLNHIKLSYIV